MKLRIVFVALLFPLLASAADDGPAQVRSAGRYLADDSVRLQDRLSSYRVDQDAAAKLPRMLFGAQSDTGARPETNLAAHPLPVEFAIFDAWVQLSGDLDADGYFHRLNVVFDADTSAELETVYVKLYLSQEGGDWYPYATSELFEIHYDSVDDTYEVMSELVEGYLPAQYDILIELHSLYHAGIVASRIVDADNAGYAITLEDLDHDDAQRLVVNDDGYVHGAGSISIAGMLMFALLLWVKFRYFRERK